ncbi:HEPN domain-containing protein [Lysinibacillus xylanilyticus]|uniref:HEPN domain-containing protein n=1 Tax=Lysinibacillus xylanilyticus TaxID=582475 RepID=UPI0036DACD74
MTKSSKILAYLKMQKNPVQDLKSNEDYFNWSKKCQKEANAFYNVSYRCIDMMLSDNRNAFFTNVSFACELYLKCLLLRQKIDCRKEHNIYKLFKKLPEEMQNEIKEAHPCGNISKNCFEQEIDDLGQAFIVFRYMYERGNMAYNVQFLLELIDTLHKYINYNKAE